MRHLHVQIDAVEQRAADLREVPLHLDGVAAALFLGITIMSAQTRVHGRHQHDVGRKHARSRGAHHRNPPVFQRLAQRFLDLVVKLGEFIQE